MASSSHSIGPVSQQYSAAATVPLIKSPSLWMPKPVELPNDIHPLPEDITAYFVYPFNLETHVLSIHPQPHDAISDRRARNAQTLHERDIEAERKEKEEMHKKAPGYNPASLLVPMSKSSPKPTDSAVPSAQAQAPVQAEELSLDSMITPKEDPLDDLASQLQQLDSRN